MKRFLTFVYDNYYPGGGWTDMREAFDTFDEAHTSMKQHEKKYGPDNFEIVDLVEDIQWTYNLNRLTYEYELESTGAA
jgi:hypothetical protein